MRRRPEKAREKHFRLNSEAANHNLDLRKE